MRKAFNDSACRQLGYSRERFAGLRIGDIDAVRSGAEIVSARRTLVPGVPQSFRTRQRAGDGSERDVQVLVQYIELDGRKLGYAVWQDVTTIGAAVHGVEETVAAVLGSLQTIVDCDLVSVILLDGLATSPEATYVSVAREVSDAHYRQFLDAVVGAIDQTTGGRTSVNELACLIADPSGRLGAAEVEDAPMATFLSMPLRAGGRLLGTLALSSSSPNAFGESALATLRLVAGPAAVVIDHARLVGVRV